MYEGMLLSLARVLSALRSIGGEDFADVVHDKEISLLAIAAAIKTLGVSRANVDQQRDELPAMRAKAMDVLSAVEDLIVQTEREVRASQDLSHGRRRRAKVNLQAVRALDKAGSKLVERIGRLQQTI